MTAGAASAGARDAGAPPRRAPCALVLDTSWSMHGEPLERLLHGLDALRRTLRAAGTAALRVEICVVATAGAEGAGVVGEWADGLDFHVPDLVASGASPLGRAMERGLEQVRARARRHEADGVSVTRPWLVMLADGAPDDVGWMKVAGQCREAERRGELSVYVVAASGVPLEALAHFGKRRPRRLGAAGYAGFFEWLGRCLIHVSEAYPGMRLRLPPARWAE